MTRVEVQYLISIMILKTAIINDSQKKVKPCFMFHGVDKPFRKNIFYLQSVQLLNDGQMRK